MTPNSEENLSQGLSESYRHHKRTVAIRHLGSRLHLTLGKIAKLVEDPDHGDVVATISLQELLDQAAPAAVEEDDEDEDDEVEEDEAPKAKPASSKSSKKAAKKAPKKAAKKTAKAPGAKKAAKKTPKADKGKPKPRLDYEQGMREVHAAIKAAKAGGHDALSRSAIEDATGFSAVQVRTFAKKLADQGRIKILGEGSRNTKYALA